jgi:hypothetical protein
MNLSAEHPEIVAPFLKRLKEFRRLKPDGVPVYTPKPQGFIAPKDWVIR